MGGKYLYAIRNNPMSLSPATLYESTGTGSPKLISDRVIPRAANSQWILSAGPNGVELIAREGQRAPIALAASGQVMSASMNTSYLAIIQGSPISARLRVVKLDGMVEIGQAPLDFGRFAAMEVSFTEQQRLIAYSPSTLKVYSYSIDGGTLRLLSEWYLSGSEVEESRKRIARNSPPPNSVAMILGAFLGMRDGLYTFAFGPHNPKDGLRVASFDEAGQQRSAQRLLDQGNADFRDVVIHHSTVAVDGARLGFLGKDGAVRLYSIGGTL
jgi:hypothetical protein